jgi:hypothetical protein
VERQKEVKIDASIKAKREAKDLGTIALDEPPRRRTVVM